MKSSPHSHYIVFVKEKKFQYLNSLHAGKLCYCVVCRFLRMMNAVGMEWVTPVDVCSGYGMVTPGLPRMIHAVGME